MTIRQKLTISFFLILLITIFIIGVFFYSIFNLNEVHMAQKHRYDQIRRVERLKEYNHSFSWIVLDIITDYEKVNIVKKRVNKAEELFESLLLKKEITIENSESLEEKKNLKLLFLHFENLYKSIRDELYTMALTNKNEKELKNFSLKFDILSNKAEKLLIDEISYLQNELDKTEKNRNEFINTIKLEIVSLLFVAFLLSFIISTKIMNDIKVMLDKLNKGVLQLFRDDENSIKIDLGKNNELSEITNNLNSYLERQDDIIHSREELLRNISHELKTPITKGKFLLESFKNKLEKDELISVNSVFVDIEELTSKLLQREKLNFVTLNIEEFKVTSLILESLSKLSIDDESKIFLDVENDFKIKGDKYYLIMVLKNLIDNAMKYAKSYPIKIKTSHNKIFVENVGEKLANDLFYYTKPFTRDPSQQIGHGLGLNIVNKIIKMHNFKLEYTYKNSSNIFSIHF